MKEMLYTSYLRFQEIIQDNCDFKPSFAHYKQQPLEIEGIDSEIRDLIVHLNEVSWLCSDSEYGSCYGFHGRSSDHYPHIALWYDHEEEQAVVWMKKLLKGMQAIRYFKTTTELGSKRKNIYEMKVHDHDIEHIEHVQFETYHTFERLSPQGRQRVCTQFWSTLDQLLKSK